MYAHHYVYAGTISPLLIFALGLLVFVIHFLPTIIAFNRVHPSRWPILILNVLFGWTGIGWLILLLWSFDTPKPLTS